jgi:CHAT domain
MLLSQALPLGYLSSPHSAFQEHAAHTTRWPVVLSSKGSQGTCIPCGVSTFLFAAFTAHKCEDPLYDFEKWYGIALCSDNKTPTKPDALVQALWPSGRQGQEMPLVVTLAICDGGNAENTIVESRGLAQELHHAGVPIVIASQLPLTFPGSEIMTRVFYGGWMAGKDVRRALHDTRITLFETKDAGHDWMSLVAWVRLPEGYNDYLLEIRLQGQLAALETASNHAKYLIENDIKDDFQYNAVTQRLQDRIRSLDQLLNELETVAINRNREVLGENTGQLGSAYKRLAELLGNRATAVPEHTEQWLAESRSALVKARDMYRKGFRRDPADHWLGVQYLALEAILTGQVSVASWYACYNAAVAQRDYPEGNEKDRIKKQIWALGSVAELGLLASLATGVMFSPDEGVAAITALSQLVQANRSLFPVLSPMDSTRRQLRRYVDWWTKANGFFATRDSDLAEEAKKLIKLL